MKIYILADMEGIAGIRVPEQVRRDAPEYAQGRELMMQEVNCAVEAACDAGATELVVCDTHGGGGQLLLERMDPRPCYEMPAGGNMMPALDADFDGVILLGHHARAGTLNGFLDHTMSSAAWFEYRINGEVVGEVGIEAAYAGHFDVPVIAVSGDAAVAAEARALLGDDLPCAVVKWGLGRNRARCLSLPEARTALQQAVREAVAATGRRQPFKPSLPATLRLTYYRSDMADDRAARPGIRRIDARTVETTVTSLRDVHI